MIYSIYAIIGMSILSITFLIYLGIGYFIHSGLSAGLRLQTEGLEFQMDMLDGKYWGNYKKMNEDIYDEDFFADFDDYRSDERESSSFFNEKMKRKDFEQAKEYFSE